MRHWKSIAAASLAALVAACAVTPATAFGTSSGYTACAQMGIDVAGKTSTSEEKGSVKVWVVAGTDCASGAPVAGVATQINFVRLVQNGSLCGDAGPRNQLPGETVNSLSVSNATCPLHGTFQVEASVGAHLAGSPFGYGFAPLQEANP